MKEGQIAFVPMYLACIFSSSPVASTDHVCCDVSVKGLAAVAPCSWNNGHCDRPQGEGGLTSTQTVVAPPRHPTHQAFDHSCPLLGQRRQRHVFIQHHGGSQLDRNKKEIHNIILIISAFNNQFSYNNRSMIKGFAVTNQQKSIIQPCSLRHLCGDTVLSTENERCFLLWPQQVTVIESDR